MISHPKKKRTILFVIFSLIILVFLIAMFFVVKFFLSPIAISEVQSINITKESSPLLVFNANKEGEVHFMGDCSSQTKTVVKGENKIAFEDLEDGVYNDCKIISTSDNETIFSIEEFRIDTTAPTTKATSTYKNGNWEKSVEIFFSCSDNISGCDDQTHYTINSGEEKRGDSISFTNEGIYKLEYWNEDKLGNKEQVHKEFNTIRVYKTTPSPEITTDDGDTYNEEFNLKYEPTNDYDHCYYTYEDSSPKEYSLCDGIFEDIRFGDDEDEDYEIVVCENSTIGRIGCSSSITIRWDTAGPDITIDNDNEIDDEFTDENDLTGIIIVLDYDEDEVETCEYSLDEDDWTEFDDCEETNVTLHDIWDEWVDDYDGDDQNDEITIYVRALDEKENIGESDSVTFSYEF
jgi:hypothetical protein